MNNTVAIVGASNVGKSSLFNAIIGEKQAIVSDIPGTTRDRHYTHIQNKNGYLTLIDTGGLGDADLPLADLFSRQTLIAIDEADIIWFVVDISKPPSQIEFDLCQGLRKQNKTIFLVLNKSDQEDLSNEYFKLGLSQLYKTSARTKAGINTLLEETQSHFPNDVFKADDDTIKIAIVGKPNVGKSSWINNLLKESRLITNDAPGTTRDYIAVESQFKGQKFQIIDTAGMQQKDRHAKDLDFFIFTRSMRAIHLADVVCIMIDITKGISVFDKRLMQEVYEIGKPFFVLANKSDLNDKVPFEEIQNQIPKFISVKEVSAYQRKGSFPFYNISKDLCHKSKQKFSTNLLNKYLEQLVFAHQPPINKGRRINIRFINQISETRFAFKIHGKQVQSLPKHYKRYLEKGFIGLLKIEGVPIKIFFQNDNNPYDS